MQTVLYMCMHVCACVCMYVWVCMYVYVCERLFVLMYVCVHVCVHTCVCVCNLHTQSIFIISTSIHLSTQHTSEGHYRFWHSSKIHTKMLPKYTPLFRTPPISCIYLFPTPNSRSVFHAGVSLNIHSFIQSPQSPTPGLLGANWCPQDLFSLYFSIRFYVPFSTRLNSSTLAQYVSVLHWIEIIRLLWSTGWNEK